MTTEQKAVAIIQAIVDLINEDSSPHLKPASMVFSDDWGGNALTISFRHTHTHVGDSHGPIDRLIDDMYDRLVEGKWEATAKRARVFPEDVVRRAVQRAADKVLGPEARD